MSGPARGLPASVPDGGARTRWPVPRSFDGITWLASAGSVLLFLALWEGVVRLGLVDRRMLPPPSTAVRESLAMVSAGLLQADVLASLRRAFSGFLLGSAIAITAGLLTGRVRLVRQVLEPIIQLFRPIPSIAFVPLAVLWFGLGETPKLFLVSYGVFFPVWINTHIGVSTVSSDYVRAARSLGCGRHQLFLAVILPAALPFVVAGLRTGISIAFVVLVAAEMTGAEAGLGYRIEQSHLVFRADRMVVGITMLGVLGALSDRLFDRVTSRFLFWAK